MADIDSLSAELDSLLNVVNRDEERCVDQSSEDEASEDNWENIEEDVHDYLSLLNNEVKPKKKVFTEDPLFPSDVMKLESQLILQAKSGKENKHLKINENKEANNVKERNRKNNLPTNKKPENNFRNNFMCSSDFAVKTISDLSKKVRDLNAQLIATHNKLRIAESKIATLQEPHNKEVVKQRETPLLPSEEKLGLLEKQVKELNDKLSNANTKLCEARNTVLQQKHEIKIMQKAIASEIGDNVNIQAVTSEGWRGRAQQIISLQQKVNDLSEKLSQTNIPSSEKTMSAILLLEKAQDKEKIASLTNELEEKKSELCELRNKNDQARARVKVLVNDLSSIKSKYEAKCVKNEEDVKLINSLTERLTNISQKFHEREKNHTRDYEEKINFLQIDIKQEKLKAEQLKKIVIDRDSKIEKLEEKMKEFKDQRVSEERPPSSWSTFQDRPPSRRSSIGGNGLPSTELERMRLMELVTVLNRRLDDERRTLESVQEQLRQEKHRSVRLETKCSRLELEKVGKGASYSRRSASTARSTDSSKYELSAARDRIALLEEKILALESRVERLRKEKEEDSRIYVRMVEEARQAMRDHVRKSVPSSNMSLP